MKFTIHPEPRREPLIRSTLLSFDLAIDPETEELVPYLVPAMGSNKVCPVRLSDMNRRGKRVFWSVRSSGKSEADAMKLALRASFR